MELGRLRSLAIFFSTVWNGDQQSGKSKSNVVWGVFYINILPTKVVMIQFFWVLLLAFVKAVFRSRNSFIYISLFELQKYDRFEGGNQTSIEIRIIGTITTMSTDVSRRRTIGKRQNTPMGPSWLNYRDCSAPLYFELVFFSASFTFRFVRQSFFVCDYALGCLWKGRAMFW